MSNNSAKWLTTLDLETFIANNANEATKTAFLGVFSINTLPRQIPHLPVLLIMNTNTSNLPGQHWKAIYISKRRVGEVFDSLAMPVNLQVEQWMNTFCKRWAISTLTLQDPFSPTCGAYVLYYIMYRLQHDSMNSWLAPFTNNVLINDMFITKFFHDFVQ